jgi:hypothetical protein
MAWGASFFTSRGGKSLPAWEAQPFSIRATLVAGAAAAGSEEEDIQDTDRTGSLPPTNQWQ